MKARHSHEEDDPFNNSLGFKNVDLKLGNEFLNKEQEEENKIDNEIQFEGENELINGIVLCCKKKFFCI